MPDYMNLFNAMSQTGDMMGQQQEARNAPPIKIRSETDDSGGLTHTLTMDDKTLQGIMGKMSYLEQALSAMSQEASRLQAQEQQKRRSPLLNVLSTVAGELAQDKRLPPVVSALGRANLALNPPPDELTARRMGLEKDIGTLGAAGLRTEISQLQHQAQIQQQQARLEETKAENLRKDVRENRTKLLQEARLVAGKGGGALSEEAFTGLARTRGFTDPSFIRDAYATHREEAEIVAKGKEKEQVAKEALIEKRGAIALRNRIAGINQGFALRTSPNAMAFQTELYKHKKAIDVATASDKDLKVVGTKDLANLKQASATDAYIDKVEFMFSQPEWRNVAGPVFSYDPATNSARLNPQAALPKAFKNIPRTQVESMISHEIPRLLTLLLNGQAGGASILRIEAGQKLIKDMGVTGAIRPDQALAIMKIIRDTNNENKAATMRAHPEVDWSKRRDLLGADTPGNREYFRNRRTFMGSPVQPFPPIEGGTTGAEADPMGIR